MSDSQTDQVADAAPLPPGDRFLNLHACTIRQLVKKTRENVILIGRQLTKCRKHCQEHFGHGAWLPWLKSEFNWSDQTARNYMNVYEMSKSKNFLNLDLPVSSLYLLAAPSTTEDARTEVIERANSGEVIRLADVKAIVSQRAATAESAGPEAKAATNWQDCRKPNGRIDRRLQWLRGAVRNLCPRFLSDPEYEIPSTLTPEMAAEDLKIFDAEMRDFLKGARAMRAKIEKVAGKGTEPDRAKTRTVVTLLSGATR